MLLSGRKIHQVRRTPVKHHKQASLSRGIVTLGVHFSDAEVLRGGPFARSRTGKKENDKRTGRGGRGGGNAAIIVLFAVGTTTMTTTRNFRRERLLAREAPRGNALLDGTRPGRFRRVRLSRKCQSAAAGVGGAFTWRFYEHPLGRSSEKGMSHSGPGADTKTLRAIRSRRHDDPFPKLMPLTIPFYCGRPVSGLPATY